MGRLAPAQWPQCSPPVRGTWDIQAVSAPEGHFLETLREEGPIGDSPLPKMERQPWYPIFTASDGDDFREQNGHQVVSQEEVRFEVISDEYLDLGVENLKARSVRGTMDPLGDGRKWTLMSIKERTEQWSPPPDRDSKLEVVRSGSLYDIRAYKGETRPTRLFGEDDEEMRYKIPPGDTVPEETKELEEERQEIVRSQVVKKSHTVAERWSSLEELENINATAPEGKGSYSTGFAICFDSPASDRVRTPVDPNGIDTEQINFAAARQQFLLLEKANPKLLLGPEKQGPSARGRSGWSSPVAGSEGYNQVGPGGLKERSHLLSFQGGVSHGRDADVPPSRPWNLEEISDTFRSVTLEEKTLEKMPDHPLDSTVAVRDAAEMQLETPIEREIRLSMEREADLWKERGIRRVSSRDELVEIPSVALLSASVSSSPASSRKGGDKPRASFNVQREIEQEIKREEDLQREGRLLGTYDKGLQLQDLAERRKVFEQGMEADVPQKGREGGEGGWSFETRSSPASGTFATEDQGSTMSWRPEAREMPPSPGTTKRRPADERSSSRSNFSLSSGLQRGPSRTTRLSLQEAPDAGDCLVLQQEHFAIPVQKVKFSFPETQRPEPRPEWASRREELYTLKTWKPRTSALIDQEIREALQRELELQAQREEARLTAEKEPGSRLSSQSSAASGIAGSYSLPTSPVFVPVGLVSGSPSPSAEQVHARRVILDAAASRDPTSPTVEQEKQKRQREGGKYAGIELCDEIDSEVVKSTKAVCQRGVLAQLWETGQIHQIYGDSD